MRYVRDELRLRVALVNPDSKAASPRELADAATYVKRLWKSHLRRSQLPDTLTDEVRRHHQARRLVMDPLVGGDRPEPDNPRPLHEPAQLRGVVDAAYAE